MFKPHGTVRSSVETLSPILRRNWQRRLHAAAKDHNQRYLSLTGLVLRQDDHDGDKTDQLNALKKDVFGHTNIVLHRREIIDAKGDYAVLSDKKIRAKFDAGFLSLIVRLSPPAFTVSIDKERHLEQYKVWQFNPYHYAMTCLLERYVLWLHYAGLIGDVIGEARGPKHDAQLRRAFNFFYKNGTAVRTDVIRARLISRELRLVAKEKNIAGVQIADLLAHPAHRAYKFEKTGVNQPKDYGTEVATVLSERLYHRSLRGRIEGYGRKWLP